MTVGNQTPPGGRSGAPIGPGSAPDGSSREDVPVDGRPVDGRPVDDAAATRSPAPPVSLPPAVPARVTMVSRTPGPGPGAPGVVDPARPAAPSGGAEAYPASSLFEPFTPVEPLTTALPLTPRGDTPGTGRSARPDDGTWSPGSAPVASVRGVTAPPSPAGPRTDRERNGTAHDADGTAPRFDGGSPAGPGASLPEREVERTGVILPVTDDGDPHAVRPAPSRHVDHRVDAGDRPPSAASGTAAPGTTATDTIDTGAAGTHVNRPPFSAGTTAPDPGAVRTGTGDTGAAGTGTTAARSATGSARTADTAVPADPTGTDLDGPSPAAGSAPDVVPQNGTTSPDPGGTGPAPDRTGEDRGTPDIGDGRATPHVADGRTAPPHPTGSPSDRLTTGDAPATPPHRVTASAPAVAPAPADAPPARDATPRRNTGPQPSAAAPLTPPPTPVAPPTTGRLRRLPVALLAVAVLVAGLAYVGYRQLTGGPPEGWRAVTSPGYELAVPDAWTAPTAGTAPVTVFGVPFGTAAQSGEYPCGQGRYVRAVAASALIAVPADIGLDQAATAFARGAGEALYPGTGAQVAVGTPTERQLSTVTASRVEATVRTNGAGGCRATDATIQVLVVPRTTAPDGEIGAAVLLVSGDLRGGPKQPAPPTRDELVAILDTAALAGA